MGEVVYTVDGELKKVDTWFLVSEFKGEYQGKKEKLCVLRMFKRMCVLPKRCVFSTMEQAVEVLKKDLFLP